MEKCESAEGSVNMSRQTREDLENLLCRTCNKLLQPPMTYEEHRKVHGSSHPPKKFVLPPPSPPKKAKPRKRASRKKVSETSKQKKAASRTRKPGTKRKLELGSKFQVKENGSDDSVEVPKKRNASTVHPEQNNIQTETRSAIVEQIERKYLYLNPEDPRGNSADAILRCPGCPAFLFLRKVLYDKHVSKCPKAQRKRTKTEVM